MSGKNVCLPICLLRKKKKKEKTGDVTGKFIIFACTVHRLAIVIEFDIQKKRKKSVLNELSRRNFTGNQYVAEKTNSPFVE